MNKTAIKNFAVWARNKLIADITYKAGLIGVSEKGVAQPLPQSSKDLQFFDIGTKDYAQVAGADIEQRNALVRAIQEKERTSDYKTAFKAVIEEVAYTWFNRLIAIRFMEVNEYLPSRIRVLSSENPAKNEPDFVTTPFDTDMEFTMAEQDRIMQLKDENKLDELFRMLFIKQCNKLHEILPELFEETNNYTELLLSISFTDNDGIVYHLVHDIPEDDFNVEKEGQVEIIGWMYQYYNIEPKDETFALLKKNVKITKERIPAATQLFTPDWIVRYMVENSLGRLWIERLEAQKAFSFSSVNFSNFSFGGKKQDTVEKIQQELKENWKYYLEEAEQEASVQEQLEQIRAEYRTLNPEDIKVIDPCMGSGHILVYCFDVLMQIYESQGYTQRDAAQSILENNLFGLDIDKRAAQLAYFAVMMKARQYDRRIFTREIKPRVYAIEESNGINRGQLKYFGADLSPLEKNTAQLQISELLDTLIDAKEYGSILIVENYNWELLRRFSESIDDAGQMSLDTIGIDQTQAKMIALIEIAHVMAQKYEVVVTNPPYMGASGMCARMSQYVKDNYPDSKSDLFAVFIERCGQMTAKNCYQAMITQHAWMFLSSFEKLRTKLSMTDIVNMAHLGARAFEEIGGEVVQTTSFVLRKSHLDYKGTYCRLVEPTTQQGKEDMFLAGENHYTAQQSNFSKIPGAPVVYWIGEQHLRSFMVGKPVSDISKGKSGQNTGDNNRFIRLWEEVDKNKIGFGLNSSYDGSQYKWIPYNKGGEFHRWYGNYNYVVNWLDDGKEIKDYAVVRNNGKHWSRYIQNLDCLYKEGITWSIITSGMFSMRYLPQGFICDYAGCAIFPDEKNLKYLLGLFNTKYVETILKMINPTINCQPGNVGSVPYISGGSKTSDVNEIVDNCIKLSKADWDSFETSWDFKKHPLV